MGTAVFDPLRQILRRAKLGVDVLLHRPSCFLRVCRLGERARVEWQALPPPPRTLTLTRHLRSLLPQSLPLSRLRNQSRRHHLRTRTRSPPLA